MRRDAKRQISPRWRTVALIAIGIAIGSTLAVTPVYSHVGGTARHLWREHIKPRTDHRYYTKRQVRERLASRLSIGIANGMGNELGCASGTVAVGIRNGNGRSADHRFTFQVPGSPGAYGQIRSDGSIRTSSATVNNVTHTARGVYCIGFAVSIGQVERETTIVSLHYSN
jgi:hypothetical protein